jgi:hypothetical protein
MGVEGKVSFKGLKTWKTGGEKKQTNKLIPGVELCPKNSK